MGDGIFGSAQVPGVDIHRFCTFGGILLSLFGCAVEVDGSAEHGDMAADEKFLGPTGKADGWDVISNADDILQLVNTASEQELDEDVGLDRRAAQGIVDARPINSLQELDDVPWVGVSAFEKLLVYVARNTRCGVSVHGYETCSDDARRILNTANQRSQSELDEEVGLDSRAAKGIAHYASQREIGSLQAAPVVLQFLSFTQRRCISVLAQRNGAFPVSKCLKQTS